MSNVILFPVKKKRKSSKKYTIISGVILMTAVLILSFSLYSPFKGKDFGGFGWWSTEKEIIKYEAAKGNIQYQTGQGEDEKYGYHFYLLDFNNSKILNEEGRCRYVFLEDKLVGFTYNFELRDRNYDINSMLEQLERKYGKPSQDYAPPGGSDNFGFNGFKYLSWKTKKVNISILYINEWSMNLSFEDPYIFNNSQRQNENKYNSIAFKGL